ncbi:hypothetical protein J6590_095299 [Homalodisca vitripennis]|nr:hypothetical protein J6590_095299 [Homalodisca vitripennis]
MDIDELIGLVYENRCLWDMRDRNYHNRDLARKNRDKAAIVPASRTALPDQSVGGRSLYGLRLAYQFGLFRRPVIERNSIQPSGQPEDDSGEPVRVWAIPRPH